MQRPGTLRRAALLVALCLQLQCHLPAAAPLSLGEDARPETREAPPKEAPARSLPEADPEAAAPEEGRREDLFQDVDPQALAALLLQALHPPPQQPDRQGRPPLEPSADEETVRSETRSSALQPEEEEEEEGPPGGEGAEAFQSLLQELRGYGAPAKREEPRRERRPAAVAQTSPARGGEPEWRRAPAKRKAAPGEPWEGARKLRQQQHLERQLLQRRYEELAESRRQAEEARRAAAEEERLADMASDLLLQYLLQDGQGAGGEAAPGAGSSALLFEDEEGNVAEDKRSNEAAPGEEDEEEEEEGGDDDDDDGDIDPGTIDRLIELSSKLHLPADDVIDIINDVEKKKKAEGEAGPPEAPGKGKGPAGLAPGDKPKKTPPFPPGPKPLQKPHYPPLWQPPRRPLPKADEDAWNEVLRGDEYPAPKWFRAQPDHPLSNYINPRTFQPLGDHPRARLPGPMAPRGEEGGEEELENYIEKVLMKRPRGF